MYTNIYVIKLTEDIEGNGTSVTNKFVVINSKERAVEAQKKAFYDCLSFWMTEWEYDKEYTIEEIFKVYKSLNKLVAFSKDDDEICCEIEEVNEI